MDGHVSSRDFSKHVAMKPWSAPGGSEKTSLARQFQESLNSRPLRTGQSSAGSSLMRRCAYLDLGMLGGKTDDLWAHILRSIGMSHRDFVAKGRIAKFASPSRKPEIATSEPHALELTLRAYPGQLTIILDEVDGLIARDRASGWAALDTLRAMTDGGLARVILVGYESLMLALDNDRFPFFGRHRAARHLGPLDRNSSDALIRDPLAELGIAFEDPEGARDRIWEASSGIPHVIQDICWILAKDALSAHEKCSTIGSGALGVAFSKSRALADMRRSAINLGLPLAEIIAGLSSSWKGGEEVKNLLARIKHEAGGAFVYDANEFRLALRHLELRLILAPLNAARTKWRWTNRGAQETMASYVQGVGPHWLEEAITRHSDDSWREHYQKLGAL